MGVGDKGVGQGLVGSFVGVGGWGWGWEAVVEIYIFATL